MTGSDEGTLERLKAFLDATFGRGKLGLERIGGGQSNPTFFVDHGDRRMVLRKKPDGPILPGAHAIEREYRVLRALEGTGVPVPKALLLHEGADVLGTPFYLMERVEGRIFHDCSLKDLPATERTPLYFAMARAMAKLHSVDPIAIGLGDFGKAGNYFQRQLSRLTRQYEESPSKRIPALDEVIKWLDDNLPFDEKRISIAHGDFRLGNVLFHPTEARVVAILDWELSTLGDPLADLGFCCMTWHTAPSEYGGILGLDRRDLQLPEKHEFVDEYHMAAVPTRKLAPFHLAFALFRFAVIFIGIADRARSGNAAGKNAEEVGPLARSFAQRALEVALAG